MSLRGQPLEADATLPDGSTVHLRIGVPDDGYITKGDLDTVAIELSAHGEHVAAVNTLLDADESSEALGLLREIVAGLESGELAPTAGAIERITDRVR